jgi:hypothetical protein
VISVHYHSKVSVHFYSMKSNEYRIGGDHLGVFVVLANLVVVPYCGGGNARLSVNSSESIWVRPSGAVTKCHKPFCSAEGRPIQLRRCSDECRIMDKTSNSGWRDGRRGIWMQARYTVRLAGGR